MLLLAGASPSLPPSSQLSSPASSSSSSPIPLHLDGLRVRLGPELRVVYPLILNLATAGEVELTGPLDPLLLQALGSLSFESGEVNLVATQLRLSREHANRAKFEPGRGIDPLLDLKLVGADTQMTLAGPASRWQDHITVAPLGRASGEQALTDAEAARLFESQLAESLLERDGQLALKKLAAATVDALMPKIESKGQFGQARWRLVSAPQIPDLLSLDPTSDPFQSLANLSFGTEVEIQYGNNLQVRPVG